MKGSVRSLAAGETAVFIEGDTTKAAAFNTAWFGSSVPAGLQIGTYSGSGIGFGSGGDQVNVFDSAGDRITGVSFGAATAGVSFDNAAGIGGTTQPPPTITTLSAAGTNGAFTAGGETGSPGTIVQPPLGPLLSTDAPTFPTQAVGTIGPGQWSDAGSAERHEQRPAAGTDGTAGAEWERRRSRSKGRRRPARTPGTGR